MCENNLSITITSVIGYMIFA